MRKSLSRVSSVASMLAHVRSLFMKRSFDREVGVRLRTWAVKSRLSRMCTTSPRSHRPGCVMFKEVMTPIINSLNASVKNGLLSPAVSGKTAWPNWMMLAGLLEIPREVPSAAPHITRQEVIHRYMCVFEYIWMQFIFGVEQNEPAVGPRGDLRKNAPEIKREQKALPRARRSRDRKVVFLHLMGQPPPAPQYRRGCSGGWLRLLKALGDDLGRFEGARHREEYGNHEHRVR